MTNYIRYVDCDVSGWVLSSLAENGWYYKEANCNVNVPTNALVIGMQWGRIWEGGVFPIKAIVLSTGADAGKIRLVLISNTSTTIHSENRAIRCYYFVP